MLLQAIENQVFRRFAPKALRHLAMPDLKTPHPLASKVLAQAAVEFQVAPPITLHSADPELMADLWCLTREAFIVDGNGRAKREAVAFAVSQLNDCPYCVAVHAGMFESTGNQASQLSEPSQLPKDIRAAHNFAAATLSPGAGTLDHSGISLVERPQIFATAILFHYINRMANVFLGETPVALPGMTSAPGRRLAQTSFRVLGKRIVGVDAQPGRCVAQRQAHLPVEFAWAQSCPAVAQALAQFAEGANLAGEESVPLEVRTLVLDHLAGWRGESAPMSRKWLEDATGSLAAPHRPIARLVLMAARSAWQVDDGLIAAFRAHNPEDRALLQTVAWGAFAAARRIASWFPTDEQDNQHSEPTEARVKPSAKAAS